MKRLNLWLVIAVAAVVCLRHSAALAQFEPGGANANAGEMDRPAEKPSQIDGTGLKRLDPNCDVWVDPKNKRVVMEGEVCLREGLLELFVCMRGYKEHEAVIRVNTKAFVVHAALLAVGAKPGNPVQFRPTFVAATGTPIDIDVYWTNEKGEKKKVRAQDWIRDIKAKAPMDDNWVFGGSKFWKDQQGQEHYAAEGGDFICVSNFPGAMLDLPIQSTDANDDLLFEAFAEHIPPRLTKVTVVLTPKLEAQQADAKPADAKSEAKSESPAGTPGTSSK